MGYGNAGARPTRLNSLQITYPGSVPAKGRGTGKERYEFDTEGA